MPRNIAAQGGFKNCAPFTKYITGIYRTTMDDSEDLDLAMQIFCILYLPSVAIYKGNSFQRMLI